MQTCVHSTAINGFYSFKSIALWGAACTLLLAGCAGTYEPSYGPDWGMELPETSVPEVRVDQMAQSDAMALDQLAPSLAPVGAACTAGIRCQSGNCADGYCCDKPCNGICAVCNVAGALGLCTPAPANTDPEDECKGESSCGGDVCDGISGCTVAKPKTTLCKASCSASKGGYLNEQFCDGAGRCAGAARSSICLPFACQAGAGGAKDTCVQGCKDHADCVKGSVCDRSGAHKTGVGVCVSPGKVVSVATHGEMFKALLAMEQGQSSKTHVFISSKSIQGPFVVAGFKVTIIGRGAAQTAITPNWAWPILSVKDGGDLTIQGLNITGSGSWGVICEALGKKTPRLTLLESTVQGSKKFGVSAGTCHAELRRNLISKNDAGGVAMLNGGVVVNNVIVGNGTLASSVGGALLTGDNKGQFTFENNTVSDNVAMSKLGYGVKCQAVLTPLKNNLVWGYGLASGDKLSGGCSFSYSLVHGLTKGKGNVFKAPGLDAVYKPRQSPMSPCIDAGAASTETVIDRLGLRRPAKAGGQVDIGAYEVR